MREQSGRDGDAQPVTVTLGIPAMLCRRCVRAISRRVRDVPGVESLEVDAALGILLVRGTAEREALVAALRQANVRACRVPPTGD
ncbi:cation transporter [Planosporangium thailandense]|uniref:Cation transporter n=1 Tax=Planosporangium thailandense TaxID=765197 RepID=A0ABX0XRF5_9ACTN|nr:heavy-metal-associated domain-containing protein [Planosporangium thailandense]NJC68594.1 cation transporter [Planosporangium thailandense]